MLDHWRKSLAVKQMADKNPVPWTPFVNTGRQELAGESFDVYHNSRYTVMVRIVPPIHGWPNFLHLSIRRNDRQVIDDWREKQRIKNEVVGPENEGVELFPAESRLRDGANQFHLFVLAESGISFPFGYRGRVVSEGLNIKIEGGSTSQQRPFDDDNRPTDLVSREELERAIALRQQHSGEKITLEDTAK